MYSVLYFQVKRFLHGIYVVIKFFSTCKNKSYTKDIKVIRKFIQKWKREKNLYCTADNY